MQKLAVIDCGTNTFHLLVAEISETTYNILYKKQFPVKLGQGGINKEFIHPDAFKRGLDALKFFADKVKELNVNYLQAFATSATRSANNGVEFENKVYNETGIKLTVIDGDREAELIFKGVQQAFPLSHENVLTMDIGGGSVEFIIGNKEEILWKGSFDIGAARLVDMFHKSNPIANEEVAALNAFLDERLVELKEALQQYPVSKLIGSAGSFESVCELINDKFNTKLLLNGETWCEIPMQRYTVIHNILLLSTYIDRLNMDALANYRVEMMVVSSCLIQYVLKAYGIEQMYCSTFALKEGALYEMLELQN
jgi:exopolyphosphatase/guanosine-5'-triphosphate,3'-diphosphate pyrophosphatase